MMRRYVLLGAICASLMLGLAGKSAVVHPLWRMSFVPEAAAQTSSGGSAYTLLAWSELGMHCMDGQDYSVFSVLPPYNVIHAQLIRKGSQPVPVTSGVTITYQAVADATGSINTISSTKTNFWDWVRTLFLNGVPPDVGLTNNATQSKTPHALQYDSTLGNWVADGIPTVPYDDNGKPNAYPMANLVAKDASGNVLATAKIVLSVSDEMSCKNCHASGSSAPARPAAGWENATAPTDPLQASKDTKFNILRKHDDRFNVSSYQSALAAKGYNYGAKLYDTAKSGTPILCATCHGSNALSAPGLPGIKPLTQDMHTLHAKVSLPGSTTTLDNATSPAGSCYLCHPGVNTKCQRGAMNKVACSNCHGNLSQVGSGSRTGWLSLPSCQMCHSNGARYGSTFSSPGVLRSTTDTHFATNPNVPATGFSLYRYSKGHGGVYCTGCHGSPHAEFPSQQPNDNVYPTALQGYSARLTECGVCHTTPPLTSNRGPHSMHTVGQRWVTQHHDYAGSGRYTACAYCHGADYRGSPLSVTKVARTFTVDDGRTRTIAAGSQIGCYNCHNGPRGGD